MAAMAYATLLVERDPGLAVVRLNRPERLNALSFQMIAELQELLGMLSGASELRCLILAGNEKAFCVGADLKERAEERQRSRSSSPFDRSRHLEKSRRLFEAVETFPTPVVAALAGQVLGGGCELALCCDLRIASTTARLGFPEGKIGAIPSAGGTQRLSRLIGSARARELLFTGEPVDAATALSIGLVHRLTQDPDPLPAARAWAAQILERAPLALRALKQALRWAEQTPLYHGLDYEFTQAAVLSGTRDLEEGRKAFLEKRRPAFKGE
ncbi:MAG: enoyl-CoA hydratase/isomerase family protein [Nitrospirae bacterium]|nr:enoyl-CoA hydratase/isomerase family protein [Nitrospirota bacterium]